MKPIVSLVLFACWAGAAAVARSPVGPGSTQEPAADWSEGRGRATSYREALAQALADALGRRTGLAGAGATAVRSRLAVVARGGEVPADWFDGEADRERAWVLQQLGAFVPDYEVVTRGKAADGLWEVAVRVRAVVASGPTEGFAIDLVDADLRQWELERYEEGAAGSPFARVRGTYEAPSMRDNLRSTGVVRIVARPVAATGDEAAASAAAPKPVLPVVASHRVTVDWQPMQFQSLVEKPNKARPTTGARPQLLTAASVRVAVKVVDLAQHVDVFERALTVAIDVPPATSVERLDALAVQLADKAKAVVAETIVFALQPPVVLRKWPGDQGTDWLVEAALSRRIAAGYEAFEVGNQGSLASPDWLPAGRAVLVGGTDSSCTFRLVDVADPARIEAGVTQVRPVRK